MKFLFGVSCRADRIVDDHCDSFRFTGGEIPLEITELHAGYEIEETGQLFGGYTVRTTHLETRGNMVTREICRIYFGIAQIVSLQHLYLIEISLEFLGDVFPDFPRLFWVYFCAPFLSVHLLITHPPTLRHIKPN